MFKKSLIAAAFAASTFSATAFAADKYTFDSSHAQVLFSYKHLGFSTTYGMFSGWSGEATLDAENPANSSVKASMKIADILTGWEKRDAHFKSADFFNAEANPDVTFASTKVEMTGEKTAKITGDLTINGVTKPVTLDATLNQMGDHPQAKTPWAGFDAVTQIKRSDFNMGKYAPYVSDEVDLKISVELQKAG